MKLHLFLFLTFLLFSTAGIDAHEHHHDKNSAGMSAMRSDSAMQSEIAKQQEKEAISAFPNYHPLVVHFPIVLLLMAVLFQILSFFFFKREFGWTTLILLALGVISAWLAGGTFHADPGDLKGEAAAIFMSHDRFSDYTLWTAFAGLLVKLISHFLLRKRLWIESVATIFLLSAAVFVSITGHLGAKLVYMEGVGPLGKYLESYTLPVKLGTDTTAENPEAEEEDHHVGEIGRGPHGGTIEEADPNHIEIVAEGSNLVFYLLDGDAKPTDMKNVTGSVKIQYTNNSMKTYKLMEMDGKLMAMGAKNALGSTAVCTLTKDGKTYSASFNSRKDLPGRP